MQAWRAILNTVRLPPIDVSAGPPCGTSDVGPSVTAKASVGVSISQPVPSFNDQVIGSIISYPTTTNVDGAIPLVVSSQVADPILSLGNNLVVGSSPPSLLADSPYAAIDASAPLLSDSTSRPALLQQSSLNMGNPPVGSASSSPEVIANGPPLCC